MATKLRQYAGLAALWGWGRFDRLIYKHNWRICNIKAPNDNFQENIESTQSELVTGEHEVKTVEKIGVEKFSISGDALGAKIKELIDQGNIRRIILKNEEGYILIEIPLTVVWWVVPSVRLYSKVLAAVGSIGAMVAHLTIVVEKRE